MENKPVFAVMKINGVVVATMQSVTIKERIRKHDANFINNYMTNEEVIAQQREEIKNLKVAVKLLLAAHPMVNIEYHELIKDNEQKGDLANRLDV